MKHGLIEYEGDRFWKKTGKKITIQGSDVAGFNKSKLECFNCHKMGHFARECRAPRSQDRGKRESHKQGPKEEEPAPEALMAIDGIGWDWSYMANEEENHALVADDEVPTEFALMAKLGSSSNNEVYDDSYCSKSCLSQVKARLVEFKEHEVKYYERIRVLERDVEIIKLNILRMSLSRAIRIAQSKSLSPVANELASLSRDNRQGEAFSTVSSLDARQDRENIAKTSALPHESSSSVPSLDADKGNQDLEISGLKARVKSLEDKDRRRAELTQENAPIIGGIIDIGEELGEEKSTKKGSNDTEEMINVLSLMKAANILSSGGTTASVSPADVLPASGVSIVSESFPTVSAIFTTSSVKVIKTEVPTKRKLQEQIDAHVAKEMEKEFARENQRLSKQLARDSKIARLHAEQELKIMIEGLDRSNEVITKHLSEYEQAESDLFVEEKIELISELVKYQDHRAKILKYQA
nr:hypothetical protein [Tanacetum cinerariifolium]